MRYRLVSVVVALGCIPLLSGCVLFAPSPEDIAGTYKADGAEVTLEADGGCNVTNFPNLIDEETEAPLPDATRFDAECRWKPSRLLYSGAWELSIATLDGVNLDLQWLAPIGTKSCLQRTIGDPDSNNSWKLCRS